MTLTTHLRVLDPVDGKALWQKAREILGSERVPFSEKEGYAKKSIKFSNPWGVGLPSAMGAEYWIEEPYDDVKALGDDPDEWDLRYAKEKPRPMFAEVWWDVTYGAPNGAAMHAYFVHELGQWLTDQGKRWLVQNEFDGEWHDNAISLFDRGEDYVEIGRTQWEADIAEFRKKTADLWEED